MRKLAVLLLVLICGCITPPQGTVREKLKGSHVKDVWVVDKDGNSLCTFEHTSKVCVVRIQDNRVNRGKEQFVSIPKEEFDQIAVGDWFGLSAEKE